MADTITARDANQRFSRLLAEVAGGKSFVITNRGKPVARLVPEPAKERGRLTPQQEKAWAETEAFLDSLEPVEPAADLPPGWPRTRDDIYDRSFYEPSKADGE